MTLKLQRMTNNRIRHWIYTKGIALNRSKTASIEYRYNSGKHERIKINLKARHVRIWLRNFNRRWSSSEVPCGSKVYTDTGHNSINADEMSFLTLRYRERGEDRRKEISFKFSVLWKITKCSPLKVNRRALLASTFTLVSWSAYSSAMKMEAMFLRNVPEDRNLITTYMRNSDTTDLLETGFWGTRYL
jgi:hypothetical protein